MIGRSRSQLEGALKYVSINLVGSTVLLSAVGLTYAATRTLNMADAALRLADLATVRAVAREAAEDEVCEAANDNDPAQVVVSGHRAAVERAVEVARERGAKRAVLLPVSAPFHCSLMSPAAERMREALAEVTLRPPVVPLVTNVTPDHAHWTTSAEPTRPSSSGAP